MIRYLKNEKWYAIIRMHCRLDDPLAQPEEHLTFNQGVPGSSPGRVTRARVAELADALDLESSGR